MTVRFFNWQTESQDCIDQVKQAIDETLSAGQFILGNRLRSFEQDFAAYIGVRHCLGVSNGLDAIRLILKALDIGPGDEVLVPAHTFIATWLPVSDLGATIVPVEPIPNGFNLDPAQAERAITEKTKAIIAVHLYGEPADMKAICELADRHQVAVVEDAAQAHGSQRHGQMMGSIGKAAAFSFYPTKNLGAVGDAGAITTNDDELYERMKKLRNYGSVVKYQHDLLGLNCRLDDLQAAVLQVKLKLLDDKNKQRKDIASRYLQGINNPLIQLPEDAEGHVWHQFVVRVEDRSAFMQHLERCGIESLIHYPVPPHLSGAYQQHHGNNRLPITENICQQVVSLPIYPGLSGQEVKAVITACNDYLTRC